MNHGWSESLPSAARRASAGTTVTYVLRSRVRPRLTDPAVNNHEPRELTASAETYEVALEKLAGRRLRTFG